MRKVVSAEKPSLALFASRNICVGEELRYDYGIKDLPWRKKSGNYHDKFSSSQQFDEIKTKKN